MITKNHKVTNSLRGEIERVKSAIEADRKPFHIHQEHSRSIFFSNVFYFFMDSEEDLLP